MTANFDQLNDTEILQEGLTSYPEAEASCCICGTPTIIYDAFTLEPVCGSACLIRSQLHGSLAEFGLED